MPDNTDKIDPEGNEGKRIDIFEMGYPDESGIGKSMGVTNDLVAAPINTDLSDYFFMAVTANRAGPVYAGRTPFEYIDKFKIHESRLLEGIDPVEYLKAKTGKFF